MTVEHLRVGDIVRGAHYDSLVSGSGAYGAAVVGCLQPFLLVSSSSDMLWSTQKAEDFQRTGRAQPEVINAIQRRIPVQHQVRAPYGESLLSHQLGCGLTLYQIGLETLAIDLNRKVKTWPCMGEWRSKIAEEDNEAYGAVFRYAPAENLWVFKELLSEKLMPDALSNAERGLVVRSTQEDDAVMLSKVLSYP